MSQALIKAHQLAQIRNGGAAAAAIKELGNRLKRGLISPEEFVVQTVAFQLLTHNQAVALAKQYLQESRVEAGVGGQIVTPVFSKERAFGQAANAAAQLAKKTLSEAALNAAINELAVSADKAAKTAGRQTIIRSTEASGRAWRRVSDGNPCAFCAMLVSRGPVYTSGQAAYEVVGVRGVARGKRKTGELFHDHCGCTVAEFYGAWSDWKPTAREQEFIDLYNRNGGSLKFMREDGQGILSDATVPENKKRKPGPKPRQTKQESVARSEQYTSVKGRLDERKVEYKKPVKLSRKLSESEIIEKISGGDMTIGSCASLSYAYVGNKAGLDVHDFRGGTSLDIFSNGNVVERISEIPGVKGGTYVARTQFKAAIDAIKEVPPGKEYLLAAGKHMAVIRRDLKTGVFYYLELQSKIPEQNGWQALTSNKLRKRFSCLISVKRKHGLKIDGSATLMEVDSLKDNKEFLDLLGYLNTSAKDQLKGSAGGIK